MVTTGTVNDQVFFSFLVLYLGNITTTHLFYYTHAILVVMMRF